LAKEAPAMVITSLSHHIDLEFLREAYHLTRKNGAPGIDGQTAEEYGRELDSHLQSLLDRFKSGRYWAPPVRRVYIPKGEGSETRPIGIPTIEDKILQRAVTMVLTAVYEQDFLDCSYGFRPERSAHQAVEAVWQGLMSMGGGWVIEVDIQKFFDTLDHKHLRGFLEQRVRDGVLRRMIDKWLKAGIFEDGSVRHLGEGTPQGGVISPLLANIYLHEVLDRWFEEEIKPRLRGKAFLVRYADDAVLVFAEEEDARRVMAVLPKRFGKYGLTLHPQKTRLIDFRRPQGPSGRGPDSFDLLGFTHFWGRSGKGAWVVKRKTGKNRFSRAVRAVAEWCRRNRHQPLREQHRALASKLRGHFGYYGITGNSSALGSFLFVVRRLWHKWLGRRSQRGNMPWEQFVVTLQRFPLPRAIAVHSVLRLAA
jgi:group II intron reverse transcriptase/maturase